MARSATTEPAIAPPRTAVETLPFLEEEEEDEDGLSVLLGLLPPVPDVPVRVVEAGRVFVLPGEEPVAAITGYCGFAKDEGF
jgi:hypothetical protein